MCDRTLGTSVPSDLEDGGDVRILVVAEDPLVRAGLRALLESSGRLKAVGQLSPGPTLEDDLETFAPDVVLWDLGWDSDSGLERLASLEWGEVPLIVLLADDNLASQAWRSGALGLLRREVGVEKLAAAITGLLEGLAVVDPAMLPPLLPPEVRSGAPQPERLTPRELDVLRLMAEGLPNKSIAARLDISEFTVKFHVNAILGKLGAQSRTEAAMTAARMGLIPL